VKFVIVRFTADSTIRAYAYRNLLSLIVQLLKTS